MYCKVVGNIMRTAWVPKVQVWWWQEKHYFNFQEMSKNASRTFKTQSLTSWFGLQPPTTQNILVIQFKNTSLQPFHFLFNFPPPHFQVLGRAERLVFILFDMIRQSNPSFNIWSLLHNTFTLLPIATFLNINFWFSAEVNTTWISEGL